MPLANPRWAKPKIIGTTGRYGTNDKLAILLK
jgi:hypothetical protein